jgi:enamine deaminase RidA (YjgF/YER057c/UK114 family)
MTPSQRMKELQITLPRIPQPIGAYVPALRIGRLVMCSGQLPYVNGRLTATGRVPDEVSIEDAAAAARVAGLNALSALAEAAGSIDRLARIVRLAVFVNSAPGFGEQPRVANGASDLMAEIFGEHGRHVRAAVGAAALPMDACVEVEVVAETTEE